MISAGDLRPSWLWDDVVASAPNLLGMHLVRGKRRAQIVEVEAYRAADDAGCHAHRGKTARNAVMFGEPGLAYVYFTYGCHWMLNVVCHGQSDAAAILIRAAEPLEGLEEMRLLRPKTRGEVDLLSGPGKLAAAFGVSRSDYGVPLFDPQSELRIEYGETPVQVLCGTRIGLARGMGDDLPWRFLDADRLKWASKPVTSLKPLLEVFCPRHQALKPEGR